MIENFSEVKKQLSELSEVINKFKSEAVQLRILEIVLGASRFSVEARTGQANDATDVEKKVPRRRTTKRKASPKEPSSDDGESKDAGKPKKARRSGQGAVSVLGDLVEQDFFKTAKTIGNIVDHCEQSLARRFKPNEFSGKLGRLTRENVLSRKKNSDNQYEYTKK